MDTQIEECSNDWVDHLIPNLYSVYNDRRPVVTHNQVIVDAESQLTYTN